MARDTTHTKKYPLKHRHPELARLMTFARNDLIDHIPDHVDPRSALAIIQSLTMTGTKNGDTGLWEGFDLDADDRDPDERGLFCRIAWVHGPVDVDFHYRPMQGEPIRMAPADGLWPDAVPVNIPTAFSAEQFTDLAAIATAATYHATAKTLRRLAAKAAARD